METAAFEPLLEMRQTHTATTADYKPSLDCIPAYLNCVSRVSPRAGDEKRTRANAPKLDQHLEPRLSVVHNLGADTRDVLFRRDGDVGVKVLLRVLVVVAAAGDLDAEAAGNLLREERKK